VNAAPQPGRTLHPDLAANPILARWISFEADGCVTLNAGKVELGQGIGIVQVQVAADELDVPLACIRLRAGHTAYGPDQGYTSGSLSTQVGMAALRQVCAEVRALFVAQAARVLGVRPEAIVVREGVFADSGSVSGAQVSYRDLREAVDLGVPATGQATPKQSGQHTHTGLSAQRPDLESKFGDAAFIHDLTLPGMVHGRVVRPPAYDTRLKLFDETSREAVRTLPGVCALLVSGDYIGVCAEREEQAVAAAAQIRRLTQWTGARALPERLGDTQAWLTDLPAQLTVVSHTGDGDPASIESAAIAPAGRSVLAEYSRPYLSHASIGPSCALAHWDDLRLTVWTQGQGSFPLQRELSLVFDIPVDDITVIHADGAGCYGHNGADDVGVDAAMLARAAGRPVRVQWSREDEFAWSPHGPAMLVQIAATLDDQGAIASWHENVWSHTHVQRPGMAEVICSLAGAHRDPPAPPIPLSDFPLARGGGGTRNAVPIYRLPHSQIHYHLVSRPVLRTSALRALGAFANVFAIESCMDELAILAERDPLEFRLSHLDDPRAQQVLREAATVSGWSHAKTPALRAGALRGRGIGFARYKGNGAYCAVVIEVEVTDRIALDRIWAVVDVGEVFNPDGLVNQIEGGILQAASWTLKESLPWDQNGIAARTWDDYPILRFDETPRTLTVHCVQAPEQAPLGAGECAAGPTAAAIANALADALGVRVRDLPLTPERLAAAANAQ
jgi:CO/xanthine dehydrogenase Mo-binding subunit